MNENNDKMDPALALSAMRVIRQVQDRLGIINGLFSQEWEAMPEREREILGRAKTELGLLEATLLRHIV